MMDGKPTISRVDYKDIYSLEKLLAAERLTTAQKCTSVLDDAFDFYAWGVEGKQVILLTPSSRILLTVQESNADAVQVDCFMHYLDWDDDPCFHTFVIHKQFLKGIKMKIMANLNLRTSFSHIVNGLMANLPSGDEIAETESG